jgi:hypothetical protein
MVRRFALTTVAACVAVAGLGLAVTSSSLAVADEAPANVLEATMLVDARLNGKDDWSPGGRQLEWNASKCPIRIQFKGQVRVDKPTKITYRWERSDGTQLPTQTFDVKAADTLVEVKPPDAWNVGNPGQQFRGAETFHVITPSDYATTTPIKVDCQ